MINTYGIILRQRKIVGDKRMLTVFTESMGKISAVSRGSTGGKTRSVLACRPFTLGSYELYGRRDVYTLGKAETVKAWYGIGENLDRYMEGSYILEFTDKLLQEGTPVKPLFDLLKEVFDILEGRSESPGFITLVYQLKALRIMGVMPELEKCVVCGEKRDNYLFHTASGGAICEQCAGDNGLIYMNNSDIIARIKYIIGTPVRKLGRIYLEDEALDQLRGLVREYSREHLDISELKSESIMND